MSLFQPDNALTVLGVMACIVWVDSGLSGAP